MSTVMSINNSPHAFTDLGLFSICQSFLDDRNHVKTNSTLSFPPRRFGKSLLVSTLKDLFWWKLSLWERSHDSFSFPVRSVPASITDLWTFTGKSNAGDYPSDSLDTLDWVSLP